MSATAPTTEYASHTPTGTGAGFPAALRSELIKLRTLRSTTVTLIIAVVLTVVLGGLFAWAAGANRKHITGVFDPTSISFGGIFLTELIIASMGALAITGEYSTGMIRTSLVAVPRRLRMLWAKVAAVAVVVLVAGEVTAFVSFFVAQSVLSATNPAHPDVDNPPVVHATLGQAHVLRAVIGAGLFLAMVALFGLAVGAILRNSALSIVATIAILLVLPIVLGASLPGSIGDDTTKFWPSRAGEQISFVQRDSHTLTAWVGFGYFAAVVLVLLVIAGVLLNRRDA